MLREVSLADAQALFALRSAEPVMKYVDKPKPASLQEIIDLVHRIKLDFLDSNGISWIITTQASDDAIGTIGFWRLDKPNHRAEVGYMLHPDYWGKGMATEAMHAVLPYAFDRLGFHSIEANVNPENEPSKKLLQKLGFVQEAYFRENYFFEGKFLDSVIFSLLKDKYISLGMQQSDTR